MVEQGGGLCASCRCGFRDRVGRVGCPLGPEAHQPGYGEGRRRGGGSLPGVGTRHRRGRGGFRVLVAAQVALVPGGLHFDLAGAEEGAVVACSPQVSPDTGHRSWHPTPRARRGPQGLPGLPPSHESWATPFSQTVGTRRAPDHGLWRVAGVAHAPRERAAVVEQGSEQDARGLGPDTAAQPFPRG